MTEFRCGAFAGDAQLAHQFFEEASNFRDRSYNKKPMAERRVWGIFSSPSSPHSYE
jgi:hypothetical protein